MHFIARDVGAHFDARNQGEVRVALCGLESLRQSIHDVVVGQRKSSHAVAIGEVDQLSRRKTPVGEGAVAVEVGEASHQATSRSRRSMECARPVSSSMTISTELKAAGPLSTGPKRFGSCVRNRSSTGSNCMPRTELTAPTMPRSVTYAVPFGSTRVSDVGTWVCVPTTALARPSR